MQDHINVGGGHHVPAKQGLNEIDGQKLPKTVDMRETIGKNSEQAVEHEHRTTIDAPLTNGVIKG